MTVEVVLRKAVLAGLPCLISVDDESADLLCRMKDGRDVSCEVKQRRNIRHLRLYWAIVKFAQMHSPLMEGVPIDKIHVALKLATGLVDTFVDSETGRLCYVPKSIAFDAMDQSKFSAWFDEAIKVIAARWMPANTTPESVRDELYRMVDGPHAIQPERSL